jgi:hypothetical protein
VTFDSPVTGTASLLVNGITNIKGGAVTTTTTQEYNGAVAMTGATTLGGTTVTFDSPVTGTASLLVNGITNIKGGTMTTTTTQEYNGAVTLDANAALVGTVVTFDATVNGAFALAIGNGGAPTNAVFGNEPGDFVGDTGAGVASLHVVGTSVFNAGNAGSATVRTTGAQTYDGAVTLNDSTTLTGSSVTFNQAVSGSKSLLVNGSTTISGGSVTTTGTTQEYRGSVTLGVNATLTGTVVTFDAAVSGSRSLLVNAATTIAGGSVTTTGTTQEYNGPVTLGANTTLTGAMVTFDQTVSGGGSLVVDGAATIKGGTITTTGATQEYGGLLTLVGDTTLTGTTVTFDQQVTGNKSLHIVGNTVIEGAGVETQNSQEYQGVVTLGHNATLQTNGASSADYIRFDGDVAGTDGKNFYDLTLLTVPSGTSATDAQIFFIAPPAVPANDVNVNVGRLFVNNDGKNDLRSKTSQYASICVIAGTPSDQQAYTGTYTIEAHTSGGKPAGLIEVSRNERLTALGTLDVRADTAHLSDITTLKDLNIYADTLLLKRHKSEPLAVAGGGAPLDNGASYVAGGKLTVSRFEPFGTNTLVSGAKVDDESTGAHASDPGIRLNAQDLTNLIGNPAFAGTQVTAGFDVSTVTIDQLRRMATSPAIGLVFALEAKASPVPLQPVVVLSPVPIVTAIATAASDSAVGKLEELGIIKFKPPTTRPATNVYDDVPLKMASGGGVEATDFLLTRNRIKQDVAEKLIALFYDSFPAGVDQAGKPTDPFVEMKAELEKAAAVYKKANKLRTVDSTAKFREFVNNTPGMEKAKLYMDRMRAFFNAVYPVDNPMSTGGAGLSMREAEASRRLFMSKLESSGEFEQISAEQVIYAVFDKDAPPKKAKPEKKAQPEKNDQPEKK